MKTNKILLIVVIFGSVVVVIHLLVVIIKSIVEPNASVERQSDSLPVVIGVSERLSPGVRFCSGVAKPHRVIKNNEFWQTVVDKNVYLYSAYYDNRYHQKNISYHYIRAVVALRNRVSDQSLHCYLWIKSSDRPLIVTAIGQQIWSDFWSKDDSTRILYKAYLMSCPVPKVYHNRVLAVSLTHRHCGQPINYLPIRSNIRPEERQYFAVCVKPMDFSEDISKRLIEWIELQLILGADVIQFYVYSVDQNARKVLDHYSGVGRVRTELMSLPGAQPNRPRIRSQYLADNVWQKRRMELIAYNDCLYRHLYSHRYVVLLDLDEAIVPRMHSDWRQMIDYISTLEPNANRIYSSFAAQNVYYFGSLNDRLEPKSGRQIVSNDLVILRHDLRSSNFSAAGFAVKSFVDTDHTLAVFNHYSLIPLYHNMSRYSLIHKSVAQLNHYRKDCPKTMFIECSDNFMKYWQKDDIVFKYRNQLIPRIESVIRRLKL